MIIDLKKYLFIGVKEDLDRFFTKAQQQGFIEFIPSVGKKAKELSDEAKNLLEAIKILRKLPEQAPYKGGGDSFLAAEIAQRIVRLKTEETRLVEEERLLRAEISRIAPFGDFSMDDLDYIEREGKRKIQFFVRGSHKNSAEPLPEELFYVGSQYELDYFIAIGEGDRHYPDMIEMRIDRSLGELKSELALTQSAFGQAEKELKAQVAYLTFLEEILVEELNSYHLREAQKEVSHPLEDALFAIEAWVPANKTRELYTLLEGMAVHGEQITCESHELVPTCFENKGTAHVGEDIVKIYDIPSHTDKDPSLWVIYAFALFFAMIIGDGGYGLLYLGTALYLKYKFPKVTGFGRRFLKLCTLLSVACILWGVLTSSFFGLQIDPDSRLGKLSLLNYLSEQKAEYHMHRNDTVYQEWVREYPAITTGHTGKEILSKAVQVHDGKISREMLSDFSDNILMEFALFVGSLHIALSLLRYSRRSWANIGWVLFIIGGYLYFPSILQATSLINFLGWISPAVAAHIGLLLVYGGIGLAVVLALIQKRLGGLGEITVVLQVFADILSYLRIYALALAGSIMASTFNDIGRDAGIILGTIYILAGHGVNISLSIMGGVIHGLRLNFIEWYHYSFEGGGRLFNPLKKLKSKIT